MSEEFVVVGKRLPRVDALEKVTGTGLFTVDIKLPRMLYGRALRSPHAHARIKKIDTSKAEKLPGVKAIVHHKNVPRIKAGNAPPMFVPDQYIFDERVRWVGDGVAAVAAVSEDVAEEALELIEVEYEVLPAVFDPEEAMKPGAPKVRADLDVERNIICERHIDVGDVERGFKEADYVFEDKYTTHVVAHCCPEPHVAIASFDLAGKLTVWSSTQVPFSVRSALSSTLGIPLNKIRVIRPKHMGCGFGSKTDIYQWEPACVLLAKMTGRPVKIELTREEEFSATRTRPLFMWGLKTGVKKDGTLTARQARVILKAGPYATQAPGVLYQACSSFASLYKAPNVRVDGYAVYTNSPMAGGFRGYGGPEAHFAFESQMDEIAEKLGMDPIELRLKNAPQTGDVTAVGWEITSCGLKECIQKAAERIGWKERRRKPGEVGDAKKRGMGMACMIHVCGWRSFPGDSDVSSATVKVDDGGRVVVVTGAVDLGQGSNTALAMIAAEELGVHLEDVEIYAGDTDLTYLDMGTYAQKVTFIGGNAVKAAAADAKRQLLEIAAIMLKANVEALEAKDRRIYVREAPEKGVTISDVVGFAHYAKPGREILGRATYDPPTVCPDPVTCYGNLSPAYGFAAQFAEVEVDVETGQVKVLRIVCAQDVGRAINPMAVESQIEGSIHMGLGYALTEELLMDKKGRTLNPNLRDYKILATVDMPKIDVIIVESFDPNGPFQAKGAAESALFPTAPATTNAIYNATGVRIKELPVTPEKILKAIKRV